MATRSTAGESTFRQTQAWLHTWCGLWFAWLLFAVCLTGALAVFDEPISHWMTPEHHAAEAATAAAEPAPPTADRAQRLAWGMAYMAQHHPAAAMWEIWPADAQGGGPLRVFWFEQAGQYASASLDPRTGAPLPEAPSGAIAERETMGGHHFVNFHYALHAGTAGLWIVAAAAMAMLVALVSGVVTHKRFFQDFFTFRRRKGQRSWLDAHNAVGVLTLPFQLMIAYTGLVISAPTLMPAGPFAVYGTGPAAQQRYQAERDGHRPDPSRQPLAMPPLGPFADRGEALMQQPVRAVVIDHPGDAVARISVYGWNVDDNVERRLSPSTGMAAFSAATGEVLHVHLAGGVKGGSAALAESVMGGLHMASFGGWAVKGLYFLCGLAGAAMMATGALLFTVKRRQHHLGEFGDATAAMYRFVEGLNVAAIAGLALACIGYLWANRLLPVATDDRAAWELRLFFGLWLLALAHAFVRPLRQAWREQLGAFAALCLLLPVLNLLTTGDALPLAAARGDWESAGVEAVALLFGLAAARTAVFLQRRSA